MGRTKTIRIKEDALGLIQMYQAGYTDGFNERLRVNKKNFSDLGEKCKKAFEKRFVKSIKKHGSNIRQKAKKRT